MLPVRKPQFFRYTRCWKCRVAILAPYSRAVKGRTTRFEDAMNVQQQLAARSVLVQGALRRDELKRTSVSKMINFKANDRYFQLVEFRSQKKMREYLGQVAYRKMADDTPVYSRFLVNYSQPLNRDQHYNTESIDESGILSKVSQCNDLTSQMHLLYECTKLRELDTRLHFFICSSLQEVLQGLFPLCSVTPFGSAVNGLGKYDCDLDMTMSFVSPSKNRKERQRVVFSSKNRSYGDLERINTQNAIEALGCMLKSFLPGYYFVNSITQARIPIVKFKHACDKECDLSLQNDSGYHMAELLWLLGKTEPRFQMLVFTIRQWAKAQGITTGTPGYVISNYMIIVMVIFFLQTRTEPILPKIRTLIDLAGPSDIKFHNGVCYKFVSDYAKVPSNVNSQNSGALLKDFFKFYADFNFTEKAICVREGNTLPKPSEHSEAELYMVNPLEPELNVGRSARSPSVKLFQLKCREAFEELEQTTKMDGGRIGQSSEWGIVPLVAITDCDDVVSEMENNTIAHDSITDVLSQDVATGRNNVLFENVDIHSIFNNIYLSQK